MSGRYFQLYSPFSFHKKQQHLSRRVCVVTNKTEHIILFGKNKSKGHNFTLGIVKIQKRNTMVIKLRQGKRNGTLVFIKKHFESKIATFIVRKFLLFNKHSRVPPSICCILTNLETKKRAKLKKQNNRHTLFFAGITFR